jgi:amidophosphoribosyltransferase
MSIGYKKMREECGVFGVYYFKQKSAVKSVYYGLFALQHRGQESAGIAVSQGEEIRGQRGMGLVNQVFDERVLSPLSGNVAIGHVRYSTTGSSVIENAQPIIIDTKYGTIALAHNGNLINAQLLRQELKEQGISFVGSSDSEVIAAMIATSKR